MTTTGATRDATPELKRRVLEAARAEPAAIRSTVRSRGWLALGCSAAIALSIFLYFGGIRQEGRPALLVVWTALGWVTVATVAVRMGMTRGRSMLGRSTSALLAMIVTIPPLLLAWKVGVTISFGPEMMARWPSRVGLRCLGLSLAMAAPLLPAFFVFRRRSDPIHPGITGAILGIGTAVLAGVLVDLWCPVAFVPHVLLGHILPLVLVGAGAAVAGQYLLRP
jgi:hypothetical protein